MREHPRRFQSPTEAPAFWLNLGSKAEVNELFREWKETTDLESRKV
jgi:hypothetical protein